MFLSNMFLGMVDSELRSVAAFCHCHFFSIGEFKDMRKDTTSGFTDMINIA